MHQLQVNYQPIFVGEERARQWRFSTQTMRPCWKYLSLCRKQSVLVKVHIPKLLPIVNIVLIYLVVLIIFYQAN